MARRIKVINGQRWIAVCRSIEVVSTAGKRVELDVEHDIAVFRFADSVYAISNVCKHQHAAILCDGLVRNGIVECPLHGWQYDITSGRAVRGSSGLEVYEVYDDGETVWLKEPEERLPSWAR
ncbi:MAG: Rieske 2Fe-2S domain-containing protein [Candidatus Kapabacteria bacterium]|jgi:nitrite reductase/ring-hydroxylating ferredoxin subunit|nr:Rieske 2Fe-2S domain-containing protein [Candidatus Kapabacteria bacterium]